MKTVMSVPAVFACAISLCAQMSSGQITTTLNHLPDGTDEVRIRNNAAINLVALVVTVRQVPEKARFVLYSDPLIEPAAKPLLPGEERVMMARSFRNPPGSRRNMFEEPVAAAGILADGSTTGDAALLARLILRRTNMLLAVETALELLSDAGRRNVPREQLIGQFRKMADSLNHWYVPVEQQVGRGLYQSIAGKLASLPHGELGTPFPPSSFVEQETGPLRQRRVALLESEPSLVDATLISTN